jgi:hypothetical protein
VSSVVSSSRGPGRTTQRDRVVEAALGVALAVGVAIEPIHNVLLGYLYFLPFLPLLLVASFRSRRVLRIQVLLLVWFAGQMMSDLYRTGGLTVSTASMAPVWLMLLVPGLYLLVRSRPERLLAVLIGIASGYAGHQLLYNPSSQTNAWKYALSLPVLLCLMAITGERWSEGRRARVFVALAAFAVISIVFDTRNGAITAVIIAACLALHRPGRAITAALAIRVVATLAFAGVVGFFAFTALGDDGLLGPRTQIQLEVSRAQHSNLILTTRPEIVQAAYHVVRHPFVGLGSRPLLDQSTYSDSLADLQRLGVTIDVNSARYLSGPDGRGLATHSAALDTAVRGGVVTLGFWILLLAAAIRLLFDSGKSHVPLKIAWSATTILNSLFGGLDLSILFLIAGFFLLSNDDCRDPRDVGAV